MRGRHKIDEQFKKVNTGICVKANLWRDVLVIAAVTNTNVHQLVEGFLQVYVEQNRQKIPESDRIEAILSDKLHGQGRIGGEIAHLKSLQSEDDRVKNRFSNPAYTGCIRGAVDYLIEKHEVWSEEQERVIISDVCVYIKERTGIPQSIVLQDMNDSLKDKINDMANSAETSTASKNESINEPDSVSYNS